MTNLKLTYKEIHNKEDAIRLGKNRGWCTSEASHYYDTAYAPYYGRLFVLFEKPRPRAQYQIFFSNNGGTELRAKFNRFIDPNAFFLNEGSSLQDWYKETKIYQPTVHSNIEYHRLSQPTNMTASEVRLRNEQFNQEIGRSLRYSNTLEQISNQNIEHYRQEYVAVFETEDDFRYNVSVDIVPELNEHERRYEPIFKVQLTVLANRVVNIHRKSELPEARQSQNGTIFHIQDSEMVLLRTIDSRNRPIYLIAESVSYIRDEPYLIDSVNADRPVSINYEERKIELLLLVHQRYFDSFQSIAVIKEVYRSGANEETIECEIRYSIERSITF